MLANLSMAGDLSRAPSHKMRMVAPRFTQTCLRGLAEFPEQAMGFRRESTKERGRVGRDDLLDADSKPRSLRHP